MPSSPDKVFIKDQTQPNWRKEIKDDEVEEEENDVEDEEDVKVEEKGEEEREGKGEEEDDEDETTRERVGEDWV